MSNEPGPPKKGTSQPADASPFELEPLAGHDRTVFSCGQEALDRYLKTQASQDIKRRLAHCFVAVERGSRTIVAYYTMTSTSLPMTDLPAEITSKLPRYPSLPAVLIGRLAVDTKFQRRGLGAALLADALQRVLAAAPAVYLFLVEAKDETAAAFYRRHGFTPILGRPLTLFLPVASAMKTLI